VLRTQVRFWRLARTVAAPNDLPLRQWAALYEEAVSVAPDAIVEVGRGYGNSTVVLTEAANKLAARVLSVGDDGIFAWRKITRPKLERLKPPGWFRPLEIVEGKAEEADLPGWLDGSRRALFFWDAHGGELAEHLLSAVVPVLPVGSRVIVHDVYSQPPPRGVPVACRYRRFCSPFDELAPVGRYCDAHRLGLDDLGGMVALTVSAETLR
jgi:hypothetical protein